jgi:hypothetical protein
MTKFKVAVVEQIQVNDTRRDLCWKVKTCKKKEKGLKM